MKKKIGSLTMALLLTLNLLGTSVPCLAAGPTFTDVPVRHWAYADVEYGAKQGYINGTGNGRFSPEKVLSFNEFITLVDRICFDGEATPVSGDSAPDSWYASHKQNLTRVGGIKNVFDWGDDGIPREEVAQVMYDCMIYLGADDEIGSFKKSVDWDYTIDFCHVEATSWCYYTGLLQGNDKNQFCGRDTLTRAEAATIVHRLVTAVDALDSGSKVNPPEEDTPVTPPTEDTPTTPSTPTEPQPPEEGTTPSTPAQPSEQTPSGTGESGEQDVAYYGSFLFRTSNGQGEWDCTEADFNAIKEKLKAVGLTSITEDANFRSRQAYQKKFPDTKCYYEVRANGDSAKQEFIDQLYDKLFEGGFADAYRNNKDAKARAEREAKIEKAKAERAKDERYDITLTPTYSALPEIEKRMSKEEILSMIKSEATNPILDDFSITFDEIGTNGFVEWDKLLHLSNISKALSLYPASVEKTLSQKVSFDIDAELYESHVRKTNREVSAFTRCLSDGYSVVVTEPTQETQISTYIHELAHAMANYVYGDVRDSAFENIYQNERQNALKHGLREYADTNCAEFFACMVEKYIYEGDVDFCQTYAPRTTALIEYCLKQCGATDAELAAIKNHSKVVYEYCKMLHKNAYDEDGSYLFWIEEITVRSLLEN